MDNMYNGIQYKYNIFSFEAYFYIFHSFSSANEFILLRSNVVCVDSLFNQLNFLGTCKEKNIA
jgi:hypothetical protein